MSAVFSFSLTDQPIDIPALAAELVDPAAGAVVTFAGCVRNHHSGRAVSRLEYHAYQALALTTGRRILEEEAARHGILRALATHRTGLLDVGEAAVWVGVASARRGAAFDAARAIIERIKYELPVWKKQTYVDGGTEWLGPDHASAGTGSPRDEVSAWRAELLEIWISPGKMFAHRIHRGGIEKRHLPFEIRLVAEIAVAAQTHAGDALDLGDALDAMIAAAQAMAPAKVVARRNPDFQQLRPPCGNLVARASGRGGSVVRP